MVDPLEGLIGRRVLVATVVPSLDDTHVVSEGNESGVGELNSGNAINEELKTNGFSPIDVSLAPKRLPVWVEVPCSPPVSNDNANAE